MSNTNTIRDNNDDSSTTTHTYFHAVGPGKQFPLRNCFRGKPDMLQQQQQQQQQHELMGDNDDENDKKETHNSLDLLLPGPELPTPVQQNVSHTTRIATPWKVFDAAAFLLHDRRHPARTTSSSSFHPNMIHSSWKTDDSVLLQVHDHISSNLSLVAVAHQTFRLAAMTVLRAMERPPPHAETTEAAGDREGNQDLPESLRTTIPSTTKVSLNAAADDDDTEGASNPNNHHHHHQATTTIASLRAYCMERSYENKEYTKRKGGKTEIMIRRPPKILKKTNKDVTQQPPDALALPLTIDSAAAVHDRDHHTPVNRDTDSSIPDPSSSSFNVEMATSSNSNKPRPTSTVYLTHAILRAAGELVLDHFSGRPQKKNDDMIPPPHHHHDEIGTPAQELAQRSIRTMTLARQRNHRRYQSRIRNAQYDHPPEVGNRENLMFSVLGDHWYSGSRSKHGFGEDHPDNIEPNDMETDDQVEKGVEMDYQPNYHSITHEWQTYCRPHLRSLLQDPNGLGHAIYIDVQWTTRHGRMADLLRVQRTQGGPRMDDTDDDDDNDDFENYGPHLILTTENEVERFAQEFRPWNDPDRIFGGGNPLIDSNRHDNDAEQQDLYVLTYQGSKKQRRHLRKLLPKATGIANASCHVVIISYDDFFDDWLHFCQIPFDSVILDDGVAWLAAKEAGSTLGSVWSSAIFSSNDQFNGLAGTNNREWDFSKDCVPETAMKEAWIGLTARHRIATGSTLAISNGESSDFASVSNLLEFVAPQFFSDIKDDWLKSKASNDKITMDHFRKLLSRFITVYSDTSPEPVISVLAEKAVFGMLESSDRNEDKLVPTVYTSDDFLESDKVLRRSVLRWLGPSQKSWIRYALGKANFQPILDAMKVSQYFGPLCEVITTTSSLTSAGATGQVSGVAAFRLATRCGRHFGSDLGLRQHILAQHAPSGTWKCRTCSIDCITSQTRTHHEKVCGQSINVESIPIEPLSSVDAPNNARQAGGVKVNSGRKKLNKPGPSGRSSSTKDAVSVVDHGENAENVVPALAVINIKDLPPDVKPLLRDPRQTSRTGGNSKRHIYAYRGVCRQARKGHDRWQSQISFAGVNHYLGTFDSEWDAAAIYAWAHLILYGEEATKLAQMEGEEAAAAYEQEQRDIAAGKMPEPTSKSDTKKRTQIRKQKDSSGEDGEKVKVDDGNEAAKPSESAGSQKPVDKLKTRNKKNVGADDAPKVDVMNKGKKIIRRNSLNGGNKTQSASPKQSSSADKEAMAIFLAKSVTKVSILGPRTEYVQISDSDLMAKAGLRLKMARMASYTGAFPAPGDISSVDECLLPCIPYSSNNIGAKGSKNQSSNRQVGGAMLVGLSASSLGWDLQSFVEESVHQLRSEQDIMAALQLLAVEYDDGVNDKFQTLIQGTVCIIGCASKLTQEIFNSLGLGSVPLGGSVGTLDCHIGGVPGSCSELAACIRYAPNESKSSLFQLSCLSSHDVVTVNGENITPEMGDVPLFHNDICSVGARVFALVAPK